MRILTKNKIILFILIAILFEPIICIKISVLNAIYILGAVVALAYAIYSYYVTGKKISKLLWIIILYRILLLIPTIIYDGGDLLKWGYLSVIIVALYMILSLHMEKEYKETISILSNIFLILTTINLLSYIIFPEGLYFDTDRYSQLYFLGIRTRFTDYAFVGIVLLILEYFFDKKKLPKLIIFGMIDLLNIILPSITTGIIAIICFVLLIILCKIKNINKLVTYNRIIVLAIILNLGIVVFNFQDNFSWILEKYFNKSASLTGRTEIWELSWSHINESPIFGHGIRNDGSFVYWNGTMWQGHNQAIQTLYDGGIIGLIIFIYIIYLSGKNLKKLKNKKIKIVLIVAIFSYMIMMITEISMYYLPVFLILFITENVEYLNESEEKNEFRNIRSDT